MFDSLVAATAGARGAVAVGDWARVESAACARRLAAMVTMLDDARSVDGSAERDLWCVDTFSAVAAHIGAAQGLTTGAAENLLFLAAALHEQLPKVAAVFADGLISFTLVRTIVTRTRLAILPDARRQIDDALAAACRSWEPRSQAKTEQLIDAIIEQFDPDAVLRTQTSARGRSVDFTTEDGTGMATMYATLFVPDAAALDARLDGLADTVCQKDPRTKEQRRADALGAVAHGADRLPCLCATDTCPAAAEPPPSGVVIHVVAHHDTIHGEASTNDDGGEKGYTAASSSGAGDGEAAGPAASLGGHEPGGGNTAASPHDAETPAADPTREECTALDGVAPPLFSKPLRELTLAEALTPPPPGPVATVRPAALMGGQFVPGSIARRAAGTATLIPIVHPGQAPPEPRYRPSKKLIDFIRCRDMTCRFPGCTRPATETDVDVDHTVAWPQGPTSASNLKCLCRHHHLLKTFWAGPGGWRDRQLPDGTVIWTAPDGTTHVTTPGSRLLFPELSEPTAPVIVTNGPATPNTGLTMPRRKTTRAEDRRRRIRTEREINQTAGEAGAQVPEPPPPAPEPQAPELEPPF